jgi:hypothetical protein
MPSASSASSGILFGHQPFPFYCFARSFSEFSYQIAAVLEERGYNFVVESLYACRTTRVQFFLGKAKLQGKTSHCASRNAADRRAAKGANMTDAERREKARLCSEPHLIPRMALCQAGNSKRTRFRKLESLDSSFCESLMLLPSRFRRA